MKKDYEAARWEHPVDWINWSQGSGRPAGVFLLQNEWHVATYDTPAERALLAEGALHVATVRFDAPAGERGEPIRGVRSIPSRVAPAFFPGSDN